VNIAEKFDLFSDHWSPKIAAELNNSYIKLAKFKGEFVWHHHENEDELFFVTKGQLLIKLRDIEAERILQHRGVRGFGNDRGVERRFPMSRGKWRTVEA
jgi:hypothetical protein